MRIRAYDDRDDDARVEAFCRAYAENRNAAQSIRVAFPDWRSRKHLHVARKARQFVGRPAVIDRLRALGVPLPVASVGAEQRRSALRQVTARLAISSRRVRPLDDQARDPATIASPSSVGDRATMRSEPRQAATDLATAAPSARAPATQALGAPPIEGLEAALHLVRVAFGIGAAVRISVELGGRK